MPGVIQNIEDHLEYFYKILKLANIYRLEHEHIGFKIIKVLIRLIIFDTFVVLLGLYYFRIKDVVDFADNSAAQFSTTAILIKSYIIICNSKKIDKIFMNLKDIFEFFNESQKPFGDCILKRLQWVRRIWKKFSLISSQAVIIGLIVTIWNNSKPPYTLQYKINTLSLFEFENSYRNFLITEFYVFIAAFVTLLLAIATDCLPVLFFSLAAGLFEELGEKIKSIKIQFKAKAEDVEEEIVKELKSCIQIYAKLNTLIADIQDFISPIISVQVVASTLIVCMIAYTVSMVCYL